jgi:hypothetical protein
MLYLVTPGHPIGSQRTGNDMIRVRDPGSAAGTLRIEVAVLRLNTNIYYHVLRFPHNHDHLSRIPSQYAIQPSYVPRPNPCSTNLTAYSLLHVLYLPCMPQEEDDIAILHIHRLFHRPASAPIKSLVCSPLRALSSIQKYTRLELQQSKILVAAIYACLYREINLDICREYRHDISPDRTSPINAMSARLFMVS